MTQHVSQLLCISQIHGHNAVDYVKPKESIRKKIVRTDKQKEINEVYL